MNAKFIISHLDQQMGPFTEVELKAKWGKGELLPIDYVFDEAKNDWILLSERFQWTKAASVAATSAPTSAAKSAVTPVVANPAAVTAPASESAPPPLRADAIKKKTAPIPQMIESEATRPDIIVPHLNLPKIDSKVEIPTPAAAIVEPLPATAVTKAEPAATPASVAMKSEATPHQATKVQLVNGVGEVDISTADPGAVELVVQDSVLKLQQPLRVQVKMLEPEEITWSFPLQHTVGNDLEISIRALDNKGNPCPHYNDDFTIKVAGADHKDITARLANGNATVKLTNTRAEVWKVSLQYNGTRSLRLPETKVLEWQPGAAARLILDGPPELIAGNPLKVQVRAVDQFGNLAKTFHGTVTLEVKAS